ncbi:MAG TPA: type IV pilus assembly protein PilM [Candidatus Paceibacterota bacterium]|nr:type IV pilus assembly protein PilM [Candidatus Paceibacterota bacterium]
MLNTKSFLTVDFGAGSLKLAEFEVNEAGGLRLKTFAIKPLGAEGSVETTREAVILKALQEALVEKGIKVKGVNVCAPGYHVFSKFVKLPPVDANKVTQIIQYEAQQNVPFPLAEVVWDYQIMGSAASGELEVLLVAVKSEVVEGLFRVAAQAKLQLQLCDASPAALINAFRYNYGDLEDCTMLLDIGAKTSNLIFFEKGKVFSRSINLGANAITHDFANEMKLKFEVAEQVKIAEGFVSLGGAYEEPESPNQAAISKIARQFMTKLHIQVNQTIQFYRGQQGGAQPQRLFLSGGASIMPYTAQFFAEKLNVPVEYFNPLRNVQIDPSVSLEELAQVAHSLGEVVGLGLRNLANCPVEMNLMPDSTLRWQAFDQKKPYFIATIFSLVLVAGAVGFLFQELAVTKENDIANLEPKVAVLENIANRFNQANAQLQLEQRRSEQITSWMEDRYYWADTLSELRRVLIRSEDDMKKKLSTPKKTIETGIWIEQFITLSGVSGVSGSFVSSPIQAGDGDAARTAAMATYNAATRGAAQQQTTAVVTTDQTNSISLVCRAVDLTKDSGDASANSETAFEVESQLRASPLFDSKATQLTGQIVPDDSTGTFTFGVTIMPSNPLRL